MHKIPISVTMITHLEPISSLRLLTTLHDCLEKAGLLAVEAIPVHDIPRSSNFPINMQFTRKASCSDSITPQANIHIQVSGIFGVIDNVTHPIELILTYRAERVGKGSKTISIREIYTVQGEIESRMTHIMGDSATDNIICISATRKENDGRVFFEIIRSMHQMELTDTTHPFAPISVLTAKEPSYSYEYKQWVSDTYAAMQPNDVEPVEILRLLFYPISGKTEHSFFTGACTSDTKNWKGNMSTILFDNKKTLRIVDFNGKMINKNFQFVLLHDNNARTVDYRLITTPKGAPVYCYDNFLTHPSNGLRLDASFVSRNNIEWTHTNRNVTSSSTVAPQARARHQVTLCFEKTESVGPMHEGLMDGIMTISDRWGQRTIKYNKNVMDSSFVGKFLLPDAQGEGSCSIVKVNRQELFEYSFYKESKTNDCNFITRGETTLPYTAQEWIPDVFNAAPALFEAFMRQAPTQWLLKVTPALLKPPVQKGSFALICPVVWFGQSLNPIPEYDLPTWLPPLMLSLREPLCKDLSNLLCQLDLQFTERKETHPLSIGVKSLDAGCKWIIKNQDNLNRAITSLNTKQRNEFGIPFQHILIATGAPSRDQSATELLKKMIDIIVKDYIPGIVVRCSLIESLYKDNLAENYPQFRTTITLNWLKQQNTVWAQKNAKEDTQRRSLLAERQKVYESPDIEAILSASVDKPLECAHLAACETLYSQAWSIANSRLLSSEAKLREALAIEYRAVRKLIQSVFLLMQGLDNVYETFQPQQQMYAFFENSSFSLKRHAKVVQKSRDNLYNTEEVARQKTLSEVQVTYQTLLTLMDKDRHAAYLATKRALYESKEVEQILTETVDMPLEQQHFAACEAVFSKEQTLHQAIIASSMQKKLRKEEETKRHDLDSEEQASYQAMTALSIQSKARCNLIWRRHEPYRSQAFEITKAPRDERAHTI